MLRVDRHDDRNQRRALEGRGRALFSGSAMAVAPASMISSATPNCRPRLAKQGHGAVQRAVVGPFVHMLARHCQRGSRGDSAAADKLVPWFDRDESETSRPVGLHHSEAEGRRRLPHRPHGVQDPGAAGLAAERPRSPIPPRPCGTSILMGQPRPWSATSRTPTSAQFDEKYQRNK